jgi:predicted secreted acid phosphatase
LNVAHAQYVNKCNKISVPQKKNLHSFQHHESEMDANRAAKATVVQHVGLQSKKAIRIVISLTMTSLNNHTNNNMHYEK